MDDSASLGQRILSLLNENDVWVEGNSLAEQFGVTLGDIYNAVVIYLEHQDWVERHSQGVGPEFEVRITERGKAEIERNKR